MGWVYKVTGQARDEGVSIEGSSTSKEFKKKNECWKLTVHLQGRGGGYVEGHELKCWEIRTLKCVYKLYHWKFIADVCIFCARHARSFCPPAFSA